MMTVLQSLQSDNAGALLAAALALAGVVLLLVLVLLTVAVKASARARASAHEVQGLLNQVKALHQDGERWFAAHREQVRALRAEIDRLQTMPAPAVAPVIPAVPHVPQAAALPSSPTAPMAPPAPVPSIGPAPQERRPVAAMAAGGVAGPAAAKPGAAAAASHRPAPPPAAAGAGAADEDGEGTLVMARGRPAPAQRGEEDDGEATLLTGLTPAERPVDERFHGLPELRVVKGPDQGRGFRLSFGRSTVGRAAGNTAQINEAKASRLHAEILLVDDRFQIRDNNSTNGTLHNGETLRTAPLEFGDVITIGGTELVFTCEGFEMRNSEPGKAITAFERMLRNRPDFVPALHNLAFLLERDVARRGEAAGVWERLKKLER